ncbi:MAG: D-alanyl-D-alanine carboxypeptidase/D-alanyl-D-alanine-endopeptidase [Gammaproteobacteria bacterium]|nr:D-alanyl-D-alanine carboxypeptidase/D-alanyl-D-alanine-endopeptidase [Gammaproteobacteria bacterium]
MRLIALVLLVIVSAAQAEDGELPLGVQRTLKVRNVPAESLSIVVADLESGATILEWRGNEPRNPASTIKLLTTLVALDVLGPAYRWRTDVFAMGELKDGRLDGDLVIKGYGDPYLVTERVWQLLRNIRQAGVKEITGDLLIDDSWFDVGDYDPGAFDRQPLRAYNVAPNALLMNFKVVRYWFEPDLANGAVDVRMDPALENLRVENRLGLANSSCRGYQRGITITANPAVDEVTFSGRFPSGCKQYAMDRTALSHNEFVYGLFNSLWRESGGVFDGGWRNMVVAEDAEPLLSFSSLPLTEMIARVNKHSNNVMARQLLYTLGAETSGAPGTEASGRAAISSWLEKNGLASTNISLANGAGLSRETRTTAADMARMLRFAWRQPYMPEYLASMSLSGLDGTLRHRFTRGQLVGKAHMKTGSMDHVAAIAGYLQARSGRRYVVVALQNFEDVHRGPGEEVQEALLRWVYEQ